jgi:hypothetical protein
MGGNGFSLRKSAGATTVLLFHILILAAFLSATRWNDYPAKERREIVLYLVTPQTPKPKEVAKAPRKIAGPRGTFSYSPPATSFVLPETMTAPAMNGQSGQFFDCKADQLATATQQQRTACAAASLSPRYDPNDVDFRDHTDRSKNAVQWARDRARKNAPLLLPCMSPGMFDPVYTAYCLGKTALQGKIDPESQPGYQDLPDHVVNEGDTRMAPTPH